MEFRINTFRYIYNINVNVKALNKRFKQGLYAIGVFNLSVGIGYILGLIGSVIYDL